MEDDTVTGSEVEECDAVLMKVKERAESGVPVDRWMTWEEHLPLLKAALFWRHTAEEMANLVLDQHQRTEENMGVVPDAKKR